MPGKTRRGSANKIYFETYKQTNKQLKNKQKKILKHLIKHPNDTQSERSLNG